MRQIEVSRGLVAVYTGDRVRARQQPLWAWPCGLLGMD